MLLLSTSATAKFTRQTQRVNHVLRLAFFHRNISRMFTTLVAKGIHRNIGAINYQSSVLYGMQLCLISIDNKRFQNVGGSNQQTMDLLPKRCHLSTTTLIYIHDNLHQASMLNVTSFLQ